MWGALEMKNGSRTSKNYGLRGSVSPAARQAMREAEYEGGFVMFLDWLAPKRAIRLVAIDIESGECQ